MAVYDSMITNHFTAKNHVKNRSAFDLAVDLKLCRIMAPYSKQNAMYTLILISKLLFFYQSTQTEIDSTIH